MYHFIVHLTEPFLVLHLLIALGLVGLWRKRPASRRSLLLATIAYAVLFLSSTDAVAYLALGSLEWAYPPLEQREVRGEAIVVLSGAVLRSDKGRPKAELGASTLRRCVQAARVYRGGPRRPVVVTGGKVHGDEPGPATAELMKSFMMELGVPERDLIVEDRSRNTHENAVYTARLLRQRGISSVVLITDATHLWRAERCFRAEGLQVVPVGCYYRATQFRWRLFGFLPDPDAAEDMEEVTHEWLGMLWYWLWGWV